MSTPRKFAAFDIDGTIVRWQMEHAAIEKVAKLGHFDPGFFDEIHADFTSWKQRAPEASFDKYQDTLFRKFEAVVKDMPQSVFLAAYQTVINEHKDRVHTYTRDLIHHLKHEGYVLFAVSASAIELVAMLAEYYGFDDYVGTTYEVRDGHYTGALNLINSKNKATALRQLIAKHHLTTTGSIGVGDSEGDIPMLEVVEHPIAFNPSKKLFRHARNQGWKIVVERKNMIYEMEPRNGTYVLAKTNE